MFLIIRWNEDKCRCECKELVDEFTENVEEVKLAKINLT